MVSLLFRHSDIEELATWEVHVFDHNEYHKAISEQMGMGMPVFSGIRQKGGGLGSVLGFLGRYAIPIISKYILPHAKTALLDTIDEIGRNPSEMQQTLKANGKKFVTNVSKEFVTNVLQKGKGIKRKQSPRKSSMGHFDCQEPPEKQSKKTSTKTKSKLSVKKTKPVKRSLTKLDIFS